MTTAVTILQKGSTSIADHRFLRDAFGAFATGVTVVTVGGGRPHGMTANSFTAVSLDPPMVLLCIARTAVMHERILATDCFAVSVLGEQQEPIARHFADSSRPDGWAQFTDTDWVKGDLTGAPIIARSQAFFECRRREVHDAGDHVIVVGEVLGLEKGTKQAPLIFAHGRMSSWCDNRPAEVPAAPPSPGGSMSVLGFDEIVPTGIAPLANLSGGPLVWLREHLLLPAEREVDPRVRGFHAWEDGASIVEPVGRAFLTGYRAGLRSRSTRQAARAIQSMTPRWRGFAMEGLGMASGIRDGLGPGGRRFADLLVHSGERHGYMFHVGLGWALARLPRAMWPRLDRFDPVVAPLVLDGYGFHEAFFRTEQVLATRRVSFPFQQRWPGRASEGEQQLMQGVGRALWFVSGGSPTVLTELVDGFEERLRGSLWAGGGLAAAYAGGCEVSTLRELQEVSGAHRAWLAQGASFGIEARVRASLTIPGTETAALELCGRRASEVSAITWESRPDPARVDAGDWSVYEDWRREVAARLA